MLYRTMLHKSNILAESKGRLRLHLVCGIHAVDQYQNAVVAFSGIIVALFTGTLWWVTRKSVIATEIAAKAARDAADVASAALGEAQSTAQHQLRAYISIDHIIRDKNLHEPGFTIFIRNSGQTPAYKVRHYNQKEILEFPLPHELVAVLREDGTRFICGPGQLAADSGLGGPISDPDWEALRSGKMAIYVYGIIEYMDVFGCVRWTKFCYFCGGPAGMTEAGYLTAYSHGNEAT